MVSWGIQPHVVSDEEIDADMVATTRGVADQALRGPLPWAGKGPSCVSCVGHLVQSSATRSAAYFSHWA